MTTPMLHLMPRSRVVLAFEGLGGLVEDGRPEVLGGLALEHGAATAQLTKCVRIAARHAGPFAALRTLQRLVVGDAIDVAAVDDLDAVNVQRFDEISDC